MSAVASLTCEGERDHTWALWVIDDLFPVLVLTATFRVVASRDYDH